MAAGVSQQELAKRVGISPALLSLWENGRRDPTITGLRGIAAELEVPAALLFAIALSSPEERSTAPQTALLGKLVDAARASILAGQLFPANERLDKGGMNATAGQEEDAPAK